MSDHHDSRAGRLAAALDEFLASSPDVEAAAVVSFDGLPMASALPDDLEEDRVGAMSAALLSLGEQAAVGLGRGRLNQVFVEGEHGFVFLMSCRDQAVLAAVAARSAKIGFMLYEMRRAADTVGQVLEVEAAPGVEPGFPATPRLATVPDSPSWTHPSTYGDHDADPVEQVVEAFAAPAPAAAWDAASPWDAPSVPAEPTWSVSPEPAYSPLGELRAVSADAATAPDTATAPAPAIPPPPSSASAYTPGDETAGDEADLLAVLATEPLGHGDDHDLLTEALFEVRRATGSDASQVPSWARPDTSDNGWG